MGNNILHEVVAVETEIQRNLEAEKERAHEWIEKVRREAEEEVARAEEEFGKLCATALEKARADAERRAARIVEESAAKGEVLKGLDSKSLMETIMKHIVRILPGGDNDRQDVKG